MTDPVKAVEADAKAAEKSLLSKLNSHVSVPYWVIAAVAAAANLLGAVTGK